MQRRRDVIELSWMWAGAWVMTMLGCGIGAACIKELFGVDSTGDALITGAAVVGLFMAVGLVVCGVWMGVEAASGACGWRRTDEK